MTLEDRLQVIEEKLGVNKEFMAECWGDRPEYKPTVELTNGGDTSLLLQEVEARLSDKIDQCAQLLRENEELSSVLNSKNSHHEEMRDIKSHSIDLLEQREYWKDRYNNAVGDVDNHEVPEEPYSHTQTVEEWKHYTCLWAGGTHLEFWDNSTTTPEWSYVDPDQWFSWERGVVYRSAEDFLY